MKNIVAYQTLVTSQVQQLSYNICSTQFNKGVIVHPCKMIIMLHINSIKSNFLLV